MAPLADWLPTVERVVVFRALMLGDLLCATPALRALRAGLPRARIALVGLPWARSWAARLDSLDEFIEFPGWPGLPERPIEDAAALPRFIARMRARQFDLAIQLHGSGRIVNPLVAAFGARHSAGFASPPDAEDPAGAWRPAADAALYAAWPTEGREVERLLALTDHLGLPRQGLQLDWPLRPADRAAAQALLASLPGPSRRAYVVVHPGSQLASRRWPPERFAAVADLLAARGLQVLITGSAGEAPLTAAVAAAMRAPAHDLAGQTSLWTLGALIEGGRLLLSNDTGPSHLAAALGTPSVVVSSGGDARRWAPADSNRHTVFWHPIACRPCAHVVCPIGHDCALAIDADRVSAAALQILQAVPPSPTPDRPASPR
jgi:ADP-heptose:LPS heptosyltransferase